MGFLGWMGWLIAVGELIVIVLWWRGGAIDNTKAKQAMDEEAAKVESAAKSAGEKISALFRKKP